MNRFAGRQSSSQVNEFVRRSEAVVVLVVIRVVRSLRCSVGSVVRAVRCSAEL